jgi:hypothetical protein
LAWCWAATGLFATLSAIGPARAQSPAAPGAAASPSAASSPAESNDPCGGTSRLLATLNRPTVGYSVCAVPPGALFLEEGYQSTFQAGGSPSVTAAYPQGFERAGVRDGLEIDLIGPTFNRFRAGAAVQSGYSDFGLGFKYEFPPKGRFTYAIDGLATGASGSAGFSAGALTQTINADISYALSSAMALGMTLAGQANSGFDQAGRRARYGDAMPSLVVTAQIPNYYQFYAELVAPTKLAPDQGGRAFVDFGLQKLVGRNVELDAEYGASFTPVAGSRFNYVGLGTGIWLQ